MGRAGEHRAHTDQGVGAGRRGQPGKPCIEESAHGGAQHGAHEEGRCENAAGAARAEREIGGQHLDKDQQKGPADGQLVGQRRRDRLVPAPKHVGHVLVAQGREDHWIGQPE